MRLHGGCGFLIMAAEIRSAVSRDSFRGVDDAIPPSSESASVVGDDVVLEPRWYRSMQRHCAAESDSTGLVGGDPPRGAD